MVNNLNPICARRTVLSASILACLLLTVAEAQAETSYTFTDLYTNTWNASTHNAAEITGINNSGTVVGSFQPSSTTTIDGTKLKGGSTYGFVGNTLFNPSYSTAAGGALGANNDITGINSNGIIVGIINATGLGGLNSGAGTSFVAAPTYSTPIQVLDTFNGSGANSNETASNLAYTYAQGINDNGLVVGWNSFVSGANDAFVYNSSAGTVDGIAAGTYKDINLSSYAGGAQFNGINNAGVAVGTVVDTTTGYADGLIYNINTNANYEFSISGSTNTLVTAINPGTSGALAGVDEIAGIWTDASGADHGFVGIWNGSSVTYLNQNLIPGDIAGTNSVYAITGINDSGKLAGYYQNSTSNVVNGFTATANAAAVPLPGAVWLMGSALVGIGFSRRRQA